MVAQTFANLPPLFTRVEYTDASEYSSRQGTDTDAFGIHHAVTTSLAGIIALSKKGGRTVSMTLAVKDDERVLIVPFDARPFTSASSYDLRSWTVEAANETLDPDYRLSDATYRSLAIIAAHAHLQEGVPLVHGVPGLYEHKNLYQWFQASYPTACAGPHFDIGRVIREALALIAGEQPDEEEDDMIRILSTAYGTGHGQPAHFNAAPGALSLNRNHHLINQMKEKGYEFREDIDDDNLNAWLQGITGITGEELSRFDPNHPQHITAWTARS